MYRAVYNGLLPSAATLDRIDQSSDTSNKRCVCTTSHIIGCVVGHLDDVVPSIVVHVGLERPDVLPCFLSQWPVKDHVGLGRCRDIAQLLACEFGTFIDDLRNSSVGRVRIVMTVDESL